MLPGSAGLATQFGSGHRDRNGDIRFDLIFHDVRRWPSRAVSIAVTPANSSLAQGYALQFAATGTYSDVYAGSYAVSGLELVGSGRCQHQRHGIGNRLARGGTTISADLDRFQDQRL